MDLDTDEKVAQTPMSNGKATETPGLAGEPSTGTALDVRTKGSSETGEMGAGLVILHLIHILRSRLDAWVVVEPSFIPLHIEFRIYHEDLKLVSHAITDYEEATSPGFTDIIAGVTRQKELDDNRKMEAGNAAAGGTWWQLAVLQKRKEKSHETARRIRRQFGSFRAMTYDDAHQLALDISSKQLNYDVIARYAKLEATITCNRAEQPGESAQSPAEAPRIIELGETPEEELASLPPEYEVSAPNSGSQESKKAYRKSKKAAHKLASKKAKHEGADITLKGSYDKSQGKSADRTGALPQRISTGETLEEKTSITQTSLVEGGGKGVLKTSAGVIALSTTSEFSLTTTSYRHHFRSHTVPPFGHLVPLSSRVVTSKDAEEMPPHNQGSVTGPAEPAEWEANLYQPFFTLRRWAYKTNAQADAALAGHGFALYDPPITYVNRNPVPFTMDVPVIVYQSRTQTAIPIVRLDEPTATIQIEPHYEPWPDMRQNIEHPDWVPDQKLVEYQAVEYMGQKYWRHDRHHLVCNLPTCKRHTVDHKLATVLCHGCGPKTIVRYCSQAHLLADLSRHWSVCGKPEFIIAHPVDEMTQPSRFYRQFPAIQDWYGDTSFEKHRQRAYAIENEGYYTLFHPMTGQPKTLKFVKAGHVHKNARIERLLNVALFDHKDFVLITYLYNYLNECLIQMHEAGLLNDFAADALVVLKQQLAREFKEFDPQWMGIKRILCDCDWFGTQEVHTYVSCKSSGTCQMRSGVHGEIIRGSGIMGLLDKKEGLYWILRVWRRQGTNKDWRLRMEGEGFAKVPEVERKRLQAKPPRMGEGWNGWGHEEHDIKG